MSRPELKLVDSHGREIRGGAPELVLTEQQQMEKLNKEVGEIMDDSLIKQYSECIVLGAQLHAWGVQYLLREGPGTPEARQAIVHIVQSCMLMPDGQTPRPFAENKMLTHLDDTQKFIRSKVEQHIKDAQRRGREIERLKDEMDKQIKEGRTDESIPGSDKSSEGQLEGNNGGTPQAVKLEGRDVPGQEGGTGSPAV